MFDYIKMIRLKCNQKLILIEFYLNVGIKSAIYAFSCDIKIRDNNVKT